MQRRPLVRLTARTTVDWIPAFAGMTGMTGMTVADGAVRAGDTDAAVGRVYLLTNDFDLTVADLVRIAGEGLERRIVAPAVPMGAGKRGFRMLEMALVLAGRRDLAAHGTGTIRMLTRNNPFTSERARRELGWAPRVTPAEGLPEAFRWWAEARSRIVDYENRRR